MSEFAFQVPLAIPLGMVVIALLMVPTVMRWHRRQIAKHRIVAIVLLRTLFLTALVLLAARPVWTTPDQPSEKRNIVALLIDRSESMSVREGDQTRYEQAVEFARDLLLPVVDQSQIQVEPILFSDEAQPASGEQIADATPDGPSTNLGQAIVQAVLANDPPPLVAIALTDGVVTHASDHPRAVGALVTGAVPLVGIGFGSQTGGRVVSLDDASAPALVEPNQDFRVTARLNATGESIPRMQLLLLRDGQLVEQRSLVPFDGPRTWTESFTVTAGDEAVHSYECRLMLAGDPSVTVAKDEATALVRVVESKEIRILYLQGGLTWDYKFANIAVAQDPTIKLSGLSRTASTSKFFENVQNDIELVGGFPNTLEKLGEFRVVVLSNLRPGDLTPFQQQLLADFCGDLGGGVLMIGGPQTFNASWRESRLEQLLPVKFAVLPDRGFETVFRIRPTTTALRNPVFQIADEASTESAWRNLPQFMHRAIVDDVKPGAETWLVDDSDSVVMASQRFGNGFASVICMQNLWRWRLARQSEPEHFDRFWRQLLRFLAEAGREIYTLTMSDLAPSPGESIELTVDHRSAAGENDGERRKVRLVVEDSNRSKVFETTLDLRAGQQVATAFTANKPGTLNATLLGAGGQILATREIDIRDSVKELADTSRNMEVLRQFAGISGGVAKEAESIDNVARLMEPFLNPEEPPTVELNYALPAGMNMWVFLLVLSCVSLEWLLRKKWDLL